MILSQANSYLITVTCFDPRFLNLHPVFSSLPIQATILFLNNDFTIIYFLMLNLRNTEKLLSLLFFLRMMLVLSRFFVLQFAVLAFISMRYCSHPFDDKMAIFGDFIDIGKDRFYRRVLFFEI